jgi:hypothetical protein
MKINKAHKTVGLWYFENIIFNYQAPTKAL